MPTHTTNTLTSMHIHIYVCMANGNNSIHTSMYVVKRLLKVPHWWHHLTVYTLILCRSVTSVALFSFVSTPFFNTFPPYNGGVNVCVCAWIFCPLGTFHFYVPFQYVGLCICSTPFTTVWSCWMWKLLFYRATYDTLSLSQSTSVDCKTFTLSTRPTLSTFPAEKWLTFQLILWTLAT